jgi:hypothetical protein
MEWSYVKIFSIYEISTYIIVTQLLTMRLMWK